MSEVSTFDLGGIQLKKWRMFWQANTGLPIEVIEKYVETIGNARAFNFDFGGIISDPVAFYTIRCFSDGVIDYSIGQCDSITTSTQSILNDPELLINIFPNPINYKTETLTIELSDFLIEKGSSLRLTNALGQIAKSIDTPFADDTYNLQVSDLNPGVYFLSYVSNGKVVQTRRVLLY